MIIDNVYMIFPGLWMTTDAGVEILKNLEEIDKNGE